MASVAEDRTRLRAPVSEVAIVAFTGSRKVYVDGTPLHPAQSLLVMNHSPDGFSWGYGGSGPSQLALALLLYVNPDETLALRHYQDFKFEHVANWPMDENVVAKIDIEAWLDEREGVEA